MTKTVPKAKLSLVIASSIPKDVAKVMQLFLECLDLITGSLACLKSKFAKILNFVKMQDWKFEHMRWINPHFVASWIIAYKWQPFVVWEVETKMTLVRNIGIPLAVPS